jgi:hypothetical protein
MVFPANGLLAYWKLDEASAGDPIIDSSGNHHDGTPVNGPLPDSPSPGPSPPNTASRSFNGVNQYVVIGNPAGLNFQGPITLSAWVNVTALSNNCQVVVSHGFRFNPSQEVALRLSGGTCGDAQGPSKWSVGSYEPPGTDHFAFGSFTNQDLGTWIHLAGVHDGATWRLYRNGTEIAATASTVGAIPVEADWAIGGKAPGDPPYAERFFHGQIDDVRIYNRALTSAEVRILANR